MRILGILDIDLMDPVERIRTEVFDSVRIVDELSGIKELSHDSIIVGVGSNGAEIALQTASAYPSFDLRLILLVPRENNDTNFSWMLKKKGVGHTYTDLIFYTSTDSDADINNSIKNAITYAQGWMAG